jgi:hypothetical protein|tara:strand:- start:331 stop:555 length:225 start_codon:yes stop_codon:yes gene_type:complete
MPDTEKPIMWNGGTTNETRDKAIEEWNKMIRQSEDYLDGVDIETIEDMTKPKINDIEGYGRTKISGMGGVKRKK